MAEDLSPSSQLLIAEYNNIATLANHIDNVRNTVTSFFLTLNGAVLVIATVLLKGELKNNLLGSAEGILATIMAVVLALGVAFVATIARLRRIQLERYRIANAILDALLAPDERAIVSLDNSRLPGDAGRSARGLDKRATGSYFWTLLIVVPNSLVGGFIVYLVLYRIHDVAGKSISVAASAATGIILFVIQDAGYFRLARP